jgi:cobalamin biosynthesis Mg chelatase CobN
MSKKTAIISIFLALAVVLSACGSSTAATSSTSQSQQITPSSLTLQNKLGLGILKLEGTSLAVTADQANTLLPLWKAVKSLSSSNLTSAAEMTALYQQIEDSLTSDQVQSIKKLSLTQSELNNLIQQNTVTSTSSSSSSSSSAQSQDGGPGMDGGMPGGGDIAAITGQTSSTTVQKTSTVKTAASSVNQLNVVFANSVVTLLQKRIS